MKLGRKFDHFIDRKGRAAFIAKTFATEIGQAKRILDVGSDYNTLKKLVGDKVLGVDLYGEPDITIDFEKEQLKQFRAKQFDFVVCTEVLEHLENLHVMTHELLRVSRKYVLISLPNTLNVFAKWNMLMHDSAGKYYGLPFSPPEDRHRWFFGYKDIDRYFEHLSRTTGFRIKDKFLVMNFSQSWKGRLLSWFVQLTGYNNASASYWILLERRSG